MKSRYLLLGSALALALPMTAQAETRGLYIGGAGGADFAIDAKASAPAGSNKVKYDTGYTGLLNLGYGFGAFRAELEGAYLANDVNGTRGAALANPGGRTRTWAAMVNGFYDINTGTAFTPYIGGGVGAGFTNASLTGTRPAGSAVGLYNGSDTTFAYQGIAGVSYALSQNLSLTTDYRYFATTDAEIKSAGTKWKVENANHIVTVGLRWSFGAPTPVQSASAVVAPAADLSPAPAPAQTTDYMVFFDWDKYNISAEARSIIAQAAAAAGQSRATIVLVTGNTDTTGSVEYNQKLSERRAVAVRRELVKLGVPGNLIETVGKGKSELAVPTDNEVREPRNRRAQIVLRLG